MSFSAFIAQYYEERLQHYERLDLRRCAETELLDAAGEASSLRKFLADILEEGYTTAVNMLTERIDAVNRLQRFLSAALHVLGPPSERERFYLMPEPVRLDHLDEAEAFAGGEVVDLQAYLDDLDAQSDPPIEIAHCFDNAQQMQRWQAKTTVMMTEMCAFLQWLCAYLAQHPHMVPVPLLRDTLLIQLGLTWLHRQGVQRRESKPALIGRKFADTCGDGRQIHIALGNVIYRVLLEDRACDLATMRQRFATYVHEDPAIPASFSHVCRDYLTTLGLDGPPLFIESGV